MSARSAGVPFNHMPGHLVIWGAGGHAKVVLDTARASDRFRSVSFLDDDRTRAGSTFCGYPVVGGREVLDAYAGCAFIVAVGHNHARMLCFERALNVGLVATTLTHPSAVIAPSAVIGKGTLVMPGAIINADAIVGENCILNSGAIVEHDCVLEDGVHVAPGAVLGGAVHVGRMAQVGLGAVVLPGGRVGREALIGAGAVVLRDAPECSVVAGVPAKVLSLRSHSIR